MSQIFPVVRLPVRPGINGVFAGAIGLTKPEWQPDGTLQSEFPWTDDIRGGGATEAGSPMTEPSQTLPPR
jgi:hypothetical protein